MFWKTFKTTSTCRMTPNFFWSGFHWPGQVAVYRVTLTGSACCFWATLSPRHSYCLCFEECQERWFPLLSQHIHVCRVEQYTGKERIFFFFSEGSVVCLFVFDKNWFCDEVAIRGKIYTCYHVIGAFFLHAFKNIKPGYSGCIACSIVIFGIFAATLYPGMVSQGSLTDSSHCGILCVHQCFKSNMASLGCNP